MRRYPSILALAIAAPLIAGCSLVEPDQWADRRDALERSRDRWHDQLVHTYRHMLTMGCECIGGFTGPVVIEVTDRQITSLVPVREDVDVPEEQWSSFHTVESLYELIDTAIDQRAYRFDVRYHPLLGYPAQISLDFDQQVVDDELLIQVSDLEIVSRVGTFE